MTTMDDPFSSKRGWPHDQRTVQIRGRGQDNRRPQIDAVVWGLLLLVLLGGAVLIGSKFFRPGAEGPDYMTVPAAK